MADRRLGRFLHLELPRRRTPVAPTPQAEGRFDRVEPAGGSLPAAGDSAAEHDRFRPPPVPALDLAEAPAGAQPFVRCARCEADNSLYAPVCQRCQADLGTEEQRTFNERLWAARREEADRLDAALAEQERRRDRDDAEALEARRRRVGAMARLEGEKVPRQLADDLRGALGRLSGDGGWAPLGMRLLRLVPGPRARLAVGGAALVLPLLLLVAAPGGSWLRLAGWVLLLLVGWLLLPSGLFRGRPR